ncbi:MAG: uridine kinase [Myxococcota bacterium]
MNDPSSRPMVIGIAGGSGSGKTTIATALADALGPELVAVLQQDAYYRDQASLPPSQRDAINYDHPDALELSLLAGHLDALVAGEAIHVPVYDFEQHIRREDTWSVEPRPAVLVEGILVLADPNLRARMDLKIFVDTPADIRVLRRIGRDIEARGRTFDQVVAQYYATVRPMHLAFVEPSKRYADIIVPEGGDNHVVHDLILGRVREHIRRAST